MTKFFTVGPVEIEPDMLQIAARNEHYFRDGHFASVVREVLDAIYRLVGAPPGSKAVILTASGTAGIEAAVLNLFDSQSHVLAVDGGSFGRRLAEICRQNRIACKAIEVETGQPLTADHLEQGVGFGAAGLLICAHETSTGQAYDLDLAAGYCRRHDMLLVVDAISAILADTIDMARQGIDALIFSANKGLALLPGLAFVVLGPKALTRMKRPNAYYLSLGPYLENAERGHTPFTSATAQILMLQERLKRIEAAGGPASAVDRTKELAELFRARIATAGLTSLATNPSNAATAFLLPDGGGDRLYRSLRDKYGFYINPPTHGLAAEIMKVGHLGALTAADLTLLADRLICELESSGDIR